METEKLIEPIRNPSVKPKLINFISALLFINLCSWCSFTKSTELWNVIITSNHPTDLYLKCEQPEKQWQELEDEIKDKLSKKLDSDNLKDKYKKKIKQKISNLSFPDYITTYCLNWIHDLSIELNSYLNIDITLKIELVNNIQKRTIFIKKLSWTIIYRLSLSPHISETADLSKL